MVVVVAVAVVVMVVVMIIFYHGWKFLEGVHPSGEVSPTRPGSLYPRQPIMMTRTEAPRRRGCARGAVEVAVSVIAPVLVLAVLVDVVGVGVLVVGAVGGSQW